MELREHRVPEDTHPRDAALHFCRTTIDKGIANSNVNLSGSIVGPSLLEAMVGDNEVLEIPPGARELEPPDHSSQRIAVQRNAVRDDLRQALADSSQFCM
jgi:hypothetical protein